MTDKFYITTPIYYVNDQPHLGHSYTTLVADILARHYRLKLGKDNVRFLTGTDEHGSKVAEKASEQGKSVEQFVDEVAAKFKTTWENLEVTNDDFIRTTEERHSNAVIKIMGKLRAAETPLGKDVLYQGEYEGLYCVGCEKFLTEKELVNGKCPLHNREPEKIKEKNWFFRLTDFLPKIQEKIESGEFVIYPETRKNETLGLIKQGLEDFSISRQSVKWGIPVPWDPEQVIYVWVEALMNYLTAIGYPTDENNFKKWWPADVQLMGLEILKFHTIFWPAILIALDLPMPKKILIHGFFTIDGQKMSKSLGNVIDPNILVEQFGSDATRYLILSQFSFGSESDIKVSEFKDRYNGELANGLGNLVARSTNLAQKYVPTGTTIPEFEATRTAEVSQLIEAVKFKEALNIIWEMISYCDQKMEEAKPWEMGKDNPEGAREVLVDILARIRVIGRLIQPFMPNIAAKIASIFESATIKKPDNLFNRID